MWGRSRPADAQAAAAARRRLDAVRAQLAAGPSVRFLAGPVTPEPASPAECEEGDQPDVPGPGEPAPPPGRHAAALSVPQQVLARVADLLPMSLHGRVGVSSQHVSVVAALLVAFLAAGSWLFLRSQPEPVTAVPPPRETGAALPSVTPAVALPPSPTPATPATTASVLVVDVAGKVRNPGIVELPPGSRVVDALEAAGGARPHVDLSGLNLARLLVDGEQILVGASTAVASPAPAGSPAATGTAPAGLVNVNTATQEQLETLPGIGPVTALAILSWRQEHGSFSTVEELLEVSGIGDATLEELRPYVTV